MERDPTPEDFVGKTIIAVDLGAANIWRFRFSDATALAIEADLHYDIPIMQICEPCAYTGEPL
jgi:hypothetical protein